MRSIPLKIVTETLPDGTTRQVMLRQADGSDLPVSYATLMHSLLDSPGERGSDRVALRGYFKANRALETAEKEGAEAVLFEDQEWQFLKQCEQQYRWGIRRPWLEEFLDAIDSAPQIDPNKKLAE